MNGNNMYLDKLATLSSTLRKASMYKSDYQGYSSLYTESYETTHQNFIVKIVRPRDIDREDDISIEFKDSSGEEGFRINFDNYYDYDFDSYGNNVTRKSLSLFIDNSEIKDQKIVSQLIEKISFESFLDKEIEISKNKYNQITIQETQRNKDEQLRLEHATQELLSRLDKMNQTSSGDIEKFKELVSNISKYHIKNFFTVEKNKDDFLSHQPTVKYLQDNFGDSKVFYKKSSNHFGDDQKTEILISNKEIKFEIVFQEYNYSSESTDQKVYLKADGKFIHDDKIISDAIGKTGLISYLEGLYGKVKTLKLAEEAQRSIDNSLKEKINTAKAHNLLNRLSNNPINDSFDFNKMPLEIDGSKIWLNKDLKLDRKDGPAVEDFNGRDFWFKNGEAYLPEAKNESNSNSQPHNSVLGLVNKFRNIFSSEDKNKKPKM
jgi:hypothetical protein